MEHEELVKNAQKGDDTAFSMLIQERKGILYKTAFIYVKNEQDALDIISETVCKAYTSLRKLKNPQFFNTWLTRILINCSIDQLRKNKKVLLLDSNRPPNVVPEMCQDELIDLYHAIDKLDERYKTIIILKYFRGLPINQIAEILDHPVGTIKTYLHKAIKELRIDLKEEYCNE